MGVIKVLPEAVANRIAAGEVIERPASMVKELVENSLDAGARKIEIEIRYGGKSLIRVADDGSGMSAADAELAFQRHATSKISSASDLERILSYGFRGEALPSIAAVSRVKVTTRTQAGPQGVELVVEGGRLLHAHEAPASKGTVIEVRDIFFNTPARRKFLKADTTEFGRIQETIQHLALARPEVHFIFKSQDKVVFDFLAQEGIQSRASQVLGEEAAKDYLEIQGETEGIRIWGLVGKPQAARANRSGQIFFMNRRWVRAWGLGHALQAGFHGLLMQGQFPSAVIFVDLDPARVDVNVHPTKQEVRIGNEVEVKSFLKMLVEKRLRQETDLVREMSTFSGTFSGTGPGMRSGPVPEKVPGNFWAAEAAAVYDAGARLPRPGTVMTLGGDTPPLPQNRFRITKILGVIHNTFIVVETEEGMMVIDQHAAHERVQFEALLRNLESEQPARQGLLMDEILEIEPRYHEMFETALPLLAKLGFEIESFGEKTFVIRAVPAIFENGNPAAILKTFLEEKEEGNIRSTLENQKEEAAALIACKRQSVKAHDALAPEGMRALVEQLARCENPFNCPHGRPAFLKYSFSELEKQFKRK